MTLRTGLNVKLNRKSFDMAPLKIFIGTDQRQPIAYNVLQYSILNNTTVPVAIHPLKLSTLPIKRVGLTEFTYSRYLVPYLCNYEGIALFLDADMIVDADIAELFELHDPQYGVQVMQKVSRFEWPSLMLFNNEKCQALTPKFIETNSPQALELWARGGIGEIPEEWNYCVGYSTSQETPKLIHYTAGIPIWPETKDSRYADRWFHYAREANSSVAYDALMRSSVHHKKVVNGDINK